MSITNQIDAALKRKEKYISENAEYRKSEAILHRHTTGKYIGDLVYGANDGLITTFAIISSAAGASLPSLVIVILGLANIVADGLSMGASNYLGGKSEQDFAKNQKQKEIWEIKHLKELEVDEIREIYEKKGFRGKDLDRAVEIITSNKDVWVDTMMKDELGIISDEDDDPKKHGLVTFLAFIVIGFVPLLPFLIPGLPNPFIISILIAGITLFLVGALRSLVTTVTFLRGGLEMFLIGASAAGAAYAIGYFIEKLVAK